MVFEKFMRKRKIREQNLPVHIGIIPDGNGRWAQKRNMPRSMGHRQGSKTLKQVMNYAADIGIKYVTIYAFSTENWKRPKEEVDALMDLLSEFLGESRDELFKKNVRVRIIGEIKSLSDTLSERIEDVEKATAENTGLHLTIALNYGGRDEIIKAVKKICEDYKCGNLNIDEINDGKFKEYLYTKDMPDPDLIIRTAGEHRVSNFLIWQGAYAEFYSSPVLWPDFKSADFDEALRDYKNRDRRYGGL